MQWSDALIGLGVASIVLFGWGSCAKQMKLAEENAVLQQALSSQDKQIQYLQDYNRDINSALSRMEDTSKELDLIKKDLTQTVKKAIKDENSSFKAWYNKRIDSVAVELLRKAAGDYGIQETRSTGNNDKSE